MDAVTTKQIQRLDDIAINQFGMPSLVLMENAGRSVTQEILKYKKKSNVVIVCGFGNNAGDGFVVARHLLEKDVNVFVIVLGKASQLKNDALVNYKILRKLKFSVKHAQGVTPAVKEMIQSADVIIDAIFGVGLNRSLSDSIISVIDIMNVSQGKVFSVDIPSGLDGTTGDIYGNCVIANKTVTFTRAKKGFLVKQGPMHVGRIVVVDIGIPQQVISKVLKYN